MTRNDLCRWIVRSGWVLLLSLGATPLGAAMVPRLMPLEEVPPPVQQALERARIDPEEVQYVYHNTVEGRTVFDFELRRENQLNPRVLFAADGTLLRDGRNAPHRNASWPIRHPDYDGPITVAPADLAGVPGAVQEAVRRHAGGRTVEVIEEQDWQGRTVYMAELETDGIDRRIYVDRQGNLMRNEQFAREVRELLRDPFFEELPEPVQETLEREIVPQQIIHIHERLTFGEPTYEIVARGQNLHFEMHVTADGRIVHDERSDPATAGEAGNFGFPRNRGQSLPVAVGEMDTTEPDPEREHTVSER